MASSRTSELGLLRIDFPQRRREGGRDHQEADGEERDPQEKGLEVTRRRAGAAVGRSAELDEEDKRVPARERQRLLGGRSPPERYRYVVHHFCRKYRTASRMKVVTKTM